MIAIFGGFEVVLDGRSHLSVRPWILGQRLRGLREFVQVEVAGSVDAGIAVGQRDAERRLAFFDVFQHLREARTHSEAEGSLFFDVLARIHELLVPLAHQRVQVVSGVLLPAQHLLLVPLRSSWSLSFPELHGVSREQLLKVVGPRELPHGSHRGRRGRRVVGFGLAARSGAASTVGGALGLFLLPGGLPLPRFFGAATGCAAGRASSLAAAGSAPTSAVASAVGASASAAAVASSMLFFLQSFFPISGPSSSGPGGCRSSGWCRAGRPRCPRSQ